jgi:hypothetical protein
MNRVALGFLVACLAGAAVHASAAETSKKATTSSTKPNKYSKPTEDELQRREVGRLKIAFMYAVESCERPNCDQQLLREIQKGYVDECKACAPQEECEADRDIILKGEGKRTYNPCVPPAAGHSKK